MTLLELAAAVTVGSIFLFPAVAVLLRRRATMLWVTTGIGFCLILWFAAFAASVPKGECPQGCYPGRVWVQPPAPAVPADL